MKKNECDYPKIKGLLFVSKYMIKKYGLAEATKKVLEKGISYSFMAVPMDQGDESETKVLRCKL